MKFYFDVDDTLYDQFIPFKKAFIEIFPKIKTLPIYQIFIKFRKYSDKIFEASQSGQVTINEMYIYRIQAALKEYYLEIDEAHALAFQTKYYVYQQDITTSNAIKDILDLLKDNHIGIWIITNGPACHQMEKLRRLKMSNWVALEDIYISSVVGYSKPDPQIFNLITDKDCIYVGDSYENDVIGAKNANWKCIWLNKKGLKAMDIKPDYEVNDEEALLNLISKIVKEYAQKM